jgi:hypothetical protein
MKIRIGLLPVSFLALGLAVAAFQLQGSKADPVTVADFGTAPAFVADAETPLHETAMQDQDPWMHPAAATNMKSLCTGSHGVNLVSVTATISLVCHDEAAAGYLVMTLGNEPKLVLTPKEEEATDQCPSQAAQETHEPSA